MQDKDLKDDHAPIGDNNRGQVPKKRGRPKKSISKQPIASGYFDVKDMLGNKVSIGELKSGLEDRERDIGEGVKKPRGRPRIHPVEENRAVKPRSTVKKDVSSVILPASDGIVDNSELPGMPAGMSGKRGPGRPRKVPLQNEMAEDANKVKRKPGRPRKLAIKDVSTESEIKTKRGPGRPRKTIADESNNVEVEGKRRPGRPRKYQFDTSADSVSGDTKTSRIPYTTEKSTREDDVLARVSVKDVGEEMLNRSQLEGSKPMKQNNSISNENFTIAKSHPNSSHFAGSDQGSEHELSRSSFEDGSKEKSSPEDNTGNITDQDYKQEKRRRSSASDVSDVSDIEDSPKSVVDPTFSAGEDAKNIRASSSTSNEGTGESSKGIYHSNDLQKSVTPSYTAKKKRRLKRTGAVTDFVPSEGSSIRNRSSTSDISNKSIVVDFTKNRANSPGQNSKSAGLASRNTILDDSYDTFDFSNHGNSGFIIPPEAFKSPRKSKTIVASDTNKKASSILGVLKNTAQSLQQLGRTERHISIGRPTSKLDTIDTNVELSEDDSDYEPENSSPVNSLRRSSDLRQRQKLHNIINNPVERDTSETSFGKLASREGLQGSCKPPPANGVEVKPLSHECSIIEKLNDKNDIILDSLHLDDHGTPEPSIISNGTSYSLLASMVPAEPFHNLPTWSPFPSSNFSNLDKDRRLLSTFLHGLLNYINVNEATLSTDIDGNLNYFIQQMPSKELEMTFSDWLDYKVDELKDEYVNEIEKKKGLLLKKFEASVEKVKNITDSKILLQLAERFGINY
ncbi:HHR227Wp [Eremothecium sinecaudum]|uniref:HHR227Wp n=1 Tax=Eremothecium sinecaudum TaxID=45286 RepID=A0A109V0L4_9SACH|nr:HHR227Wp [Eremothecium sinecaudum]AMD22996.1 HHR227Wp [Eremothecium sinecaudum]